MNNTAREEFELMQEMSPKEWYFERVDGDEDEENEGEIRYEAHGPKSSFVIFNGPNAKADCESFMQAQALLQRQQSDEGLIRELVEALNETLKATQPSYHDCLDNGEPECHFCIADRMIQKASTRLSEIK